MTTVRIKAEYASTRKARIVFAFSILILFLLGTNLFVLFAFFLIPPPFSPGRLPNFGERKIVSNTLPLEEKWQYKADGLVRQISSQNNQVYVWSGSRVTALDAETGKEEWTFPSYNRLGLLTAVGDSAVAFFPSAPHENVVSVLDATTGQFRWKTQLIEPLSLAIGDGRLYVGMMNVSAYDLTSGRLVWKMAREMPSHTIINVYYASMKLYVVAEEQVYILDASDGQVLESFESAGAAYQTVTDGEIFGVDRSQFASATDIESGRLQWKKYIHPFGLVPTLIRGALYVITDDLELLALDRETGEQKWKSETIQRPFSSVVELNGLGYVLSDTGRLYAFDLTTGQAVGILDTGNGLPFDFGNDFRPSLIVAGKTLVFSFEDSPIYGFRAKSP